MIWKDKEIKTMGDILNTVQTCQNRAEAQDFMFQYRQENPYAKENIGYLAGYMSHEDATKIFEWFDCEHPVFGNTFPTAEEAFKAGLKICELSNKYGSKKALEMLGYTKQPSPWHIGINEILSKEQ